MLLHTTTGIIQLLEDEACLLRDDVKIFVPREPLAREFLLLRLLIIVCCQGDDNFVFFQSQEFIIGTKIT